MSNTLGYTVTVREETTDEGRIFVARVKELSDVVEYADTASDAYDLAVDTIETTSAMFAEAGRQMPPRAEEVGDEFSGRLTLRVPRTLHRTLVETAADEAVSINQYMVNALSYVVGVGHGHREVLERWTSLVLPQVHQLAARRVISARSPSGADAWIEHVAVP